MKLRNKNVIGTVGLMVIFLLFLLFLFPCKAESSQGVGTNAMNSRIEKLKSDVGLTEEQVPLVKELFTQAQAQAQMDRETYKSNAQVLINAAMNRELNIDRKMESILLADQYRAYMESRKIDPRTHEIFILSEGLLLTDEQILKVEEILDAFHKEMEAKRKESHARMGKMESNATGGTPEGIPPDGEEMDDAPPQPPPGGGDRPPMGGMPGMGGMGRMGGMPGMEPGGRGHGGHGMPDMSNSPETKKDNAIKKLLAKDQQKLFEQILQEKKEKREAMRQGKGGRPPHPMPVH